MQTFLETGAHALGIKPGITAVCGSGGKSTFLGVMGRTLTQTGKTVALATSTHMYPVAGVPWESSSRCLTGAAWRSATPHAGGCTCEQCAATHGTLYQVGSMDAETGKLGSPAQGFDGLVQRASHVLVEADGSHRLPLKAHAAHEPVIPTGTESLVWIVGASGLGKPIDEVVHRPHIFCELTGARPNDEATPELVAKALAAELSPIETSMGLSAHILLNQVDDEERMALAFRFRQALGRRIVAGSLQGGLFVALG